MWRQAMLQSSRRTVVPLVAAASATLCCVAGSLNETAATKSTTTKCETQHSAAQPFLGVEKQNLLNKVSNSWTNTSSATATIGGSMRSKHIMGTFHQLFPLRQLWNPVAEYPLWDDNWDGKGKPESSVILHNAPVEGPVRHMILIPHGQEDVTADGDEEEEEDSIDIGRLNCLGCKQAKETGKRLAELLEEYAKDHSIALRVSDLTRAKETAGIVAKYLPTVNLQEADPLLNEGRPCHNIPGHRVYHIQIQAIDRDQPRIEQAFRKYFYRADAEGKDEVEIIVAHPNVLRYFLTRAMQLPPETHGRYSLGHCSITYLAIMPNGVVSCRTLGDVGHLSMDKNDKQRFLW